MEKSNFTFQRNVAIVGILLFVGKLVAWRLTNSDAVLSDAMESIVNIIAAFMGLYSLYLTAKPRDHDHPYGHGKIEFITSGIEGFLIAVAGIMIIIQSIESLVNGKELQQLDWGVGIISITALVNYLMGYYSYRKGIKENSPVLQSSGKHLQSDTFTTIGVAVSLLLVHITGLHWIDAAVASAFGGYIIFIGSAIVRKALKGIMDEADPEILHNIATLLNQNRQPEWIDVHNMKIQQYGSKLHIDGHITLPWYFELKTAHQEMEKMITLIAKNTNRSIEFNFHMDDCKPFSCEICQLDNCPMRKLPFSQKIEWTKETIAQPNKHNFRPMPPLSSDNKTLE